MNSNFRNVAFAAGIALVFVAGCSSKTQSGADALAQQRKDVLGRPMTGAEAESLAKMRDQSMAAQQKAQQDYMAQHAQQGGKR